MTDAPRSAFDRGLWEHGRFREDGSRGPLDRFHRQLGETGGQPSLRNRIERIECALWSFTP
jgi:hypothetical protein